MNMAKAKKLHLRLVVDVTYLPQGVSEVELREMLGEIAAHAMAEGLVTHDTEAEVDTYSFHVETVPEGKAENLSSQG
jgi:hypothetical protein